MSVIKHMGNTVNGGAASVDILKSYEELDANTEPGKVVDALLVKDIKDNAGSGGSGGLGFDAYTEGETVIGVWTDGKPLYRLIVKITLPTANDRPIYELSDKSIDALVDRKLLSINKNHSNLGPSYTVVVPYAVAQQYYSQIWWQLDASQSCIKFYTSELSVYAGQPALLILEYTKTTDPINSFNPNQLLNPKFSYSYEDYSEGEKIIGRWIDGKPLYRKFVKLTSYSGEHSYEHNIANVDHITINTSKTYGIDIYDSSKSLSIWMASSTNSTVNFTSYTFFPVWVDNVHIALYVGDNLYKAGLKELVVALEYTKTTDTAGSFKPSMVSGQTDYDILASKEELEANTEPGKLVDALFIKAKFAANEPVIFSGDYTVVANVNNVIKSYTLPDDGGYYLVVGGVSFHGMTGRLSSLTLGSQAIILNNNFLNAFSLTDIIPAGSEVSLQGWGVTAGRSVYNLKIIKLS